ncbi:protein-L-isoaspartate(D-aspartate) O-methyltransferase [Rhizobiales bacterium]|uniref:protein-L-isoaspartate(D-aspartate) O-methyltransferase n=1 Tax=Hongsoonwoonella zoysiae TaxID=2821844 RepID=UPI00155FD3CC|nr:protein-L-isoaspartate(D-aspartate) O-methyltransferase [Hongsoonwoonella zoysiae]NRG18863.1 protein-L-isoaspartate(D-aspartate) O-methyltransferase [Hongsoonwoonella zoysiae]
MNDDFDHESPEPTPQEAEARAGLALELRKQGIRDRRVLSAIERVPRRFFLTANLQKHAYDNTALPIECGQTISQPTVVGMMTEALDVKPEHRVLEIGTGSGFQAAVLGHLADEVHSVERYRTLADLARDRLSALKLPNVTVHFGDGMLGLAEHAPFDRIIVTAAADKVPQALMEQLEDGGKLVVPVGPSGGIQELVLYEKTPNGLVERNLGAVRFVPLLPGAASSL